MRLQEPDFVQRARRRITKRGDAALRRLRPTSTTPLLEQEPDRLASEIALCVSPTLGETAARRKASEIGEYYVQLDEAGQRQFFTVLADSFGLDRPSLDVVIERRNSLLAAEPIDQAAVLNAEREMRKALAAPRELLFTRLNGLHHGVKFVVDLREDLRALRSEDPRFRTMDNELKDLLSSWFDLGHLELRQITWETPAAVLERLIKYESVHEIESWDDLKNRLDIDRRCYAFFHPSMADEPLIFVEVALVEGIAGDLSELLDLDSPLLNPEEADTAIFYSISNCQAGLAGVNLGDLLIKQVVAALLHELPDLTTFSTLSPIPGFRGWLDERLETDGDGVFRSGELVALRHLLNTNDVDKELRHVLDRPDWPEDRALAEGLREPLLRLGASYITEQKRGAQALGRVANFHISNGARVERLNWLANTSPVGLQRSAGLMVNYRYVPEDISANHEAYATEGIIPVVDAVRKLTETDS